MSSNQSLPERTDAIYRELRSLRWRFRIGGWITLIVGSLLLLLLTAYFTYGYRQISDLRDPELIVSLVGNTVDQQIPVLRQRIESEVSANAPIWAEQASQQALSQIPTIREQLQRAALVQADEAIAKIDVLGEQQFRKIINENRTTVQQAIDQLKSEEQVSEEVVLGLQLALEKELQIDAENQADAVQAIVGDLNKAMKNLHAGENLSEEQQAERRVLMLARRWQMESFPNAKLDISQVEEQLGLATVKEIVSDKETERVRQETIKQVADHAAASVEPAAETAAPNDKRPAEAAAEEKREPAAEEKAAEAAEPAAKAEETKADAKPAEKPADQPAETKQAVPEDKPAGSPEAKKAAEEPGDQQLAEEKDAPAGEKPAEAEKAAEEKPANQPVEADAPAEEKKES